MKELLDITDKELAARIVSYIKRLDALDEAVSDYLDRNYKPGYRYATKQLIQFKYESLKKEIHADIHYLDLGRNQKPLATLYSSIFKPSIIDAAVNGFRSKTNAAIDHEFYSSIYIARSSLTDYYSLDRWMKRLDS